MSEWLNSKIQCFTENTNEAEIREGFLLDIKVKLTGLKPEEAQDFVKDVILTSLIDELTATDSSHVSLTCEVLKLIMQHMDPVESLKSNNLHFLKLLASNKNDLKCLALEELVRISSDKNGLNKLMANVDILKLIIEIIADPSLEVAKFAITIVTNLGKTTDGVRLLQTGELSSSIAKLIALNNTVRFRVYDIFVSIAKQGTKEIFDFCVSSGLFLNVTSILEEDDVLLQLNALEVFSELASFEMGFNYLQRVEVVERLEKNLEDALEIPFRNLIVPGYLKFFSVIVQIYPQEVVSKYSKVVLIISHIIINEDDTSIGMLIPAAVESIGHFAATVEAKYGLQNLNIMPPILKKIANMICTETSELKVICLNSLAQMLHVDPSQQDNKILTLTKSWFDLVSEEPLRLLENMCRQPFLDIKFASLNVLAEIASQQWGQEYISDFPALVEFLLDRSVESFKQCKEVKYKVVKSLSESPQNIFDGHTMQQLKKFVHDGPFHVDIVTEVALEEAS